MKARSIAMLRLLHENGYNLENLADLMEDLNDFKFSEEIITHNQVREEAAKEKYLMNLITKKLLEMGIPVHIAGFDYLRTAIFEVYNNPSLIHGITTDLYPLVGSRHGKPSSAVERGMNHAIEYAFKNMSSETCEKYFAKAIIARKKKASNSVFIGSVVENLRMENL